MEDLPNKIDKTRAIKILFSKILPVLRRKRVKLLSYWDADLSAIGFGKGTRLLYINESEFNYKLGTQNSIKLLKFDCDFELYRTEIDLAEGKNKIKIQTCLGLSIASIKLRVLLFFK